MSPAHFVQQVFPLPVSAAVILNSKSGLVENVGVTDVGLQLGIARDFSA